MFFCSPGLTRPSCCVNQGLRTRGCSNPDPNCGLYSLSLACGLHRWAPKMWQCSVVKCAIRQACLGDPDCFLYGHDLSLIVSIFFKCLCLVKPGELSSSLYNSVTIYVQRAASTIGYFLIETKILIQCFT